jgi:thiosulfate reductase cytochrome b subunit
MHFSRIQKILFFSGLALILIATAIAVQVAFTHFQSAPVSQASPIHPEFPLLDKDEKNVLESGAPLSTMKTCGQCHDTQFISSHSFHIDLGLSEQTAPGEVTGGQPWDTSSGLYGHWDPLTYRYLSPTGDTRHDLTPAEWVKFNASRIVGGGPGEVSGVEVDCFLCHTSQPNNNEKVNAIQNEHGEWAVTATLAGAGLVDANGDGTYTWNPTAFTAEGIPNEGLLAIQDPTNANCAQCHGLVHTDNETPVTLSGCSLDERQTATTGQVIAAQDISQSGMNLEDKVSLSHSWDIHAERGVTCTDCHYSLNNPVYYQADAESKPENLQFDPRRLEIGEYLEKPDHNFARGQSAQTNVAAELKGSMRRCDACHSIESGHADWLPYVEQHMEKVACETCHIPQMNAPAVQSYDWTVLQADGQPVTECRGVEGDSGTIQDLVTGFQPVLLTRSNIDGENSLTPYNLVTAWYWVYDSPEGPRPVLLEDLQAVWFSGEQYAPEILAALDSDGNGTLSSTELRLDTSEKVAVITGRLEALGLANPHIEAQVQPYSINHNVVRGEWVTRDCQTCHTSDSRLAAPLTLASYLPGGVVPEPVSDTNIVPSGEVKVENDSLVYQPDTAEQGLYVFGHNRAAWIDWLGGLMFLGVLAAVVGHGSLRFYQTLRRPRHQPELKKVYMYEVYERFWHWLQTIAIVLLLITGLIIHRPDLFGWMSFRYSVTVHNVMAVILVVNAALSLFYHLVSGRIRQFIPHPYGFFDDAIVQAKFYLKGIFKNEPHPFTKTPEKKMNPLQQATYIGILDILLPLQIITGILMWGAERYPRALEVLGGLPFLAPFHSLVAWTFAAFIVAHVYLTTTSHAPLASIKAMVNGWEDVELHTEQHEQSQPTAEQPVESIQVGQEPSVEEDSGDSAEENKSVEQETGEPKEDQ